MFDGPALGGAAKVNAASLVGPAGPVELLVADNTTPGMEGYIPSGAELIPRHPLAPSTRYTATIAARVNGVDLSHSWSFTTGAKPNRVSVGGWGWDGRTLTIDVSSMAPGATVTAGGVSVPLGSDGKASFALGAGRWQVCATSGDGDVFQITTDCRAVDLLTGEEFCALFGGCDTTTTTTTTTTAIPPTTTGGTTTGTTGTPRETKAASTLRWVKTRATRSGSRLAVRVECSAACRLQGRAKLVHGRATRALVMTTGGRSSAGAVTLRFTLPAATRRWLKTHRRARLALTVTAAGTRTLTATVPIVG